MLKQLRPRRLNNPFARFNQASANQRSCTSMHRSSDCYGPPACFKVALVPVLRLNGKG